MSNLTEREIPSGTSSTSIMSSQTSEIISTTSDGCVKCEGTVKCPVCGPNEYCVMTSLTCNSCPSTYCATRNNQTLSGLLNNGTLNNGTSNNSNNNNTVSTNLNNHNLTVHKIVGGVVGSVLGLIVIIMIVWYSFYVRKRNAQVKANNAMGQDKNYNANDIEDLEMDDIEDDDLYDTDDDDDDDDDEMDDIDIENVTKKDSTNNTNSNNIIQSKNSNTMMTPQQYVNELRSMNPHGTVNNNNNNTLSVVGNRMSTASTVRTGASNILPIGYIPGVTSGSGTNNSNSNLNNNSHLNIVGDIRSHITLGSSILDSSMFGDDEVEIRNNHNESQRPKVDRRTKPSDSTSSSLTTAIKGSKPKLVQIAEEEESVSPPQRNEDLLLRNSVISDATGTGSYILDFEIESNNSNKTGMTPQRPQPPIPAVIPSTYKNSFSRLNSNNNDDITSTILSDMITIDTAAIEKMDNNSKDKEHHPTTLDPFSDEHKL